MPTDDLSPWQQQALDEMRARLLDWLPDHKLHLVLIRAPFRCPHTGIEVTDPAFEKLLVTDPDAAQRQLQKEFEADRIAGIERDKQRTAERQEGRESVRSFVKQRRSRARSQRRQATQPEG